MAWFDCVLHNDSSHGTCPSNVAALILLWAVQENVINERDKVRMLSALEDLQIRARTFLAVPFSEELPEVSETRAVFYGSTGVMQRVAQSRRWTPGVFINDNFDFRVWRDKLRTLNFDAQVVRLEDIREHHFHGTNSQAFIRPVLDLKEFAGNVFDWAEFQEWQGRLHDLELLKSCQCVVAEPVGLAKEWRVFLVNGKAVAGSLYREYFQFRPSSDVPGEVLSFAEEQARNWSPHSIFVLDVGLSGKDLWVVEIGSFNSAGFYNSDLHQLFDRVHAHAVEYLL